MMQIQNTVESVVEQIYSDIFGERLCVEDYNVSLSNKGIDSLDTIDLIYNIEEKFNIKLDFDIKKSSSITLADVVNVIKSKI
jgi:acyl carrier protein